VLPPAGWRPPRQCLFIAGVHRSGSTLLCAMLSATGRLGAPDEYFKPAGKGAADDAEIARRLTLPATRGMTANGVAAVKIFANHFRDIAPRCNLDLWYPTLGFVMVQREDKLAQAISWARANQTKQFRAWDRQKAEPRYARDAISASLAKILTLEAEWDFFFARNDIRPVRVTYEGFLADPHRSVRAICELVGEEVPPSLPAIDELGLKVQRDGLTQDWRERYLQEMRGLDRFDALAGFTRDTGSRLGRLVRSLRG
jgi:LPS sulfotransferase NodH